jgi:peptidoglycan biosynthesis protein MviN/MurJ (putative lipid II flippase)
MFFPDLSIKKTTEQYREVEEFSQVVIMLTAGTLGICVLSIGAAIPYTRKLALTRANEFKKKFLYNGILRTI